MQRPCALNTAVSSISPPPASQGGGEREEGIHTAEEELFHRPESGRISPQLHSATPETPKGLLSSAKPVVLHALNMLLGGSSALCQTHTPPFAPSHLARSQTKNPALQESQTPLLISPS